MMNKEIRDEKVVASITGHKTYVAPLMRIYDCACEATLLDGSSCGGALTPGGIPVCDDE